MNDTSIHIVRCWSCGAHVLVAGPGRLKHHNPVHHVWTPKRRTPHTGRKNNG